MARYRMAPHAGRLLCPPDRCWTNSKATAAFSLLFSRRQNCKSQYVSENTRVSRKDKDQSQQGQTAASQPGRPAALAPGVARAVAGGRPTAATGGWGGGGMRLGGPAVLPWALHTQRAPCPGRGEHAAAGPGSAAGS